MERKDAESAQSVPPSLSSIMLTLNGVATQSMQTEHENGRREGLFSPFCVCARESSLIRPPPPSLDIHRETEANTDTCAIRVGGKGREERADRA